jgi:hypothetical protein
VAALNSKIKNTHNTIQLFAENKAMRERGRVDHYRNRKEFGKDQNIPNLVLTASFTKLRFHTLVEIVLVLTF